jgi:chromate reductase
MAHTIVTIAGSLRKESFSLKIANALAKLAPASLKLDVVTLQGISFFNQDLEANPPADWLAFREKIQKSDGVLFVTPEYNRAIPGVLKNAIDVASRPYGKSSFLGKPIGIISNSPGPLGGVNAAKSLQNILPGITGPIMGSRKPISPWSAMPSTRRVSSRRRRCRRCSSNSSPPLRLSSRSRTGSSPPVLAGDCARPLSSPLTVWPHPSGHGLA